MVFLEIKFTILLMCSFMMFRNLHPSLYLDLPIVKIESGEIFGDNNAGSHFAFKGIPYAQAERFAPPKRYSRSWHQILPMKEFGSECAQYDHMSYSFKGSENCLSLNVFVPKRVFKSNASVAVIVFIHGGAFQFGSSEFYGADIIMEGQNLILVTINYRLGVLGFLSTEDETLPGNLGLKDQVEALKWVQRNIKQFNGDPNRVTLSGFSAGGASVQLHYLSELSNGLFNNGISHSGVALNPWVMTENAREKAFEVGNLMGCNFHRTHKPDSEKLLKCLKRIPVEKLVMVAKHFQPFLYNPFTPFGVVVEKDDKNSFLIDHPQKILERNSHSNRSFIASVTQDDGLYPTAEFYNKDTLKLIDENFNELAPILLDFDSTTKDKNLKLEWAQQIRKYYFGDEKISLKNFEKLSKLMTDRIFKTGFYNALKMQSLSSASYCYYFRFHTKKTFVDILNNETKNLGIAHGDDLFLIFNNRKLDEYTKEEQIIGRNFVQMYEGIANMKEVNYANTSLFEIKDELKCLEIISSSNFSMTTLNETFGEIQFWKSLNISE